MRFVLMFKIGILGTSQERYPLDVTLGRHVFRKFLRKRKTIIQLTLEGFRHKFGEMEVKIM